MTTPPTPTGWSSMPHSCGNRLRAARVPAPVGPGRPYTVDERAALSATQPKGRNFANGKQSFAAARCVVCHRFNGEGGRPVRSDPGSAPGGSRCATWPIRLSSRARSFPISIGRRRLKLHDGRRMVGRITGSTPEDHAAH